MCTFIILLCYISPWLFRSRQFNGLHDTGGTAMNVSCCYKSFVDQKIRSLIACVCENQPEMTFYLMESLCWLLTRSGVPAAGRNAPRCFYFFSWEIAFWYMLQLWFLHMVLNSFKTKYIDLSKFRHFLMYNVILKQLLHNVHCPMRAFYQMFPSIPSNYLQK